MTTLQAAILLFLVLDPLGNIFPFTTVLQGVPPARRVRVVLRELVLALGILVVFLMVGKDLLAMLQIQEPSLSIAGGIILFIIAINMVFPMSNILQETIPGEPLLVPLAVPLVAGPSALTTVLLLSTQYPDRMVDWFAALVLAWIPTSAILVLSGPIARLFGERGIWALQRLMGMLLIAIAVQMFMTGIAQFVRALG